jgi:multidrug efflux pump subunit AcrA (membrane-fusion protein)
VSTDDPQRTQEWNAPPEEGLEQPEAAEARQAELRAELAETDARRAEEDAGKAHGEVEQAERREEKLSRKERKLKEAAEEAQAAADDARRRAEEATAATVSREPSLSGAHVTSPGLGSETDPAAAASAAAPHGTIGHDRMAVAQGALERPEVQAGLAFAGAFVVARILKRIFD